MSLSPQLLRNWTWAWTRSILQTPQRRLSWTARPLSQSSRPDGGDDGRFQGMLQNEAAITKETKMARAARTTVSKGAVKATPQPSPVNSPPWSRFAVARDPNRTPLPRHQEPQRAHGMAYGSADRQPGAGRGRGGRPLPRGDKFRGKAGVAPARDGRGTEEHTSSPFSSGIPARAPFRPLGSRADEPPRGSQGDLASTRSGHARFAPTPKPIAKTVQPDALRYEPTDYKDPVTSKYLVAKERFRPSAKKDWSTPQKLCRENWLPRTTLNTRLVGGAQEDAQEAPSPSAGSRNAMHKASPAGPNAVTGAPAQMEAETRPGHPLEGKASDEQMEVARPSPGKGTVGTPPRKSPARAEQDAKRRLELIERRRKYLCGKHGVDPDASRHGHEEEIQEALEQWVQQYDFKAERRQGRTTGRRTKRRKVRPEVSRRAAKHREEARQQAQRLAGAILGSVPGSARGTAA